MTSLVCERGFADTSLAAVCQRARVSRRTFHATFDSREDCFVAILDVGHTRASELIAEAFSSATTWKDGLRDALSALLLMFDENPAPARAWFVESLAAGQWALEHRESRLAELTEAIVARWPPPEGVDIDALAAPAVVAAILGVIVRHIMSGSSAPLITLLGPLVGVAVSPFLDVEAVALETKHAEALSRRLVDRAPRGVDRGGVAVPFIPDIVRNPRSHRARACLCFLLECPGASNRQVAAATGIASHAQISVLLARLAASGLLVKHAGRPGAPNAWYLTEVGERVAHTLPRAPGSCSV
jgi:AcrR family transcriptional regulator